MWNNSVKSSGFTLVELMITLAIAGILVAVGIPSFNSLISSNRLTTYANELVTALNLARSEAVKRGIQVTIRRSGNTNNNWDSGWDIFTDLNGNGELDDDGDTNLCESNGVDADCLLRTYPALTNGYTLRSNNYPCWVTYNAIGLSRGSSPTSSSECSGGGLSNNTFRLCDSAASTTNSLSIVTNLMGRARTSEGTDQCP